MPEPKEDSRTAAQPRAVVIGTLGENWKVEIKEFGAFRETLGPEVVNAFCRCFVHSDRLQSLVSFAYVSMEYHGRDSVPFTRNLQAMVWFTVGTLRELAKAIRQLRSALAKRGLLEADTEPWLKLRGVEKRWEDDPFFRTKRDTIAFHVDEDVIETGLQALAKEKNVLLSENEGHRADGSHLRLGNEALIKGCGMDEADFARFFETVRDDHGIGEAIQEAFIEVVNRAGFSFGDD